MSDSAGLAGLGITAGVAAAVALAVSRLSSRHSSAGSKRSSLGTTQEQRKHSLDMAVGSAPDLPDLLRGGRATSTDGPSRRSSAPELLVSARTSSATVDPEGPPPMARYLSTEPPEPPSMERQ
eukprot:7136447-Prymnesium_polylepis.1